MLSNVMHPLQGYVLANTRHMAVYESDEFLRTTVPRDGKKKGRRQELWSGEDHPEEEE